jgi:hypothetical protein
MIPNDLSSFFCTPIASRAVFLAIARIRDGGSLVWDSCVISKGHSISYPYRFESFVFDGQSMAVPTWCKTCFISSWHNWHLLDLVSTKDFISIDDIFQYLIQSMTCCQFYQVWLRTHMQIAIGIWGTIMQNKLRPRIVITLLPLISNCSIVYIPATDRDHPMFALSACSPRQRGLSASWASTSLARAVYESTPFWDRSSLRLKKLDIFLCISL